LSAVARRTGPAPQRAAAMWPPCAAPTARVKALSGRRRVPTARTPRPRPPRLAPCAASRPPRPRRRQPPRMRRRRPDRLCPRARCPSRAVAAVAASRAHRAASPRRASGPSANSTQCTRLILLILLTPSWSEELLGDNHRQASRRLTLFLNKASTDA
jgi:hypothetical protein